MASLSGFLPPLLHIEQRLSELEFQMGPCIYLFQRMASLEARTGELSHFLNAIGVQLHLLEVQCSSNKAFIEKLEERMRTQEKRTGSTEQELGTHQGNIKALQMEALMLRRQFDQLKNSGSFSSSSNGRS